MNQKLKNYHFMENSLKYKIHSKNSLNLRKIKCNLKVPATRCQSQNKKKLKLILKCIYSVNLGARMCTFGSFSSSKNLKST